jgi:hypothetical protein
VKGNVYLDLADKNRGRQNVLGGSGIFRFNSCGTSLRKSKYSGDAATSITKIKYKLINSAIADSRRVNSTSKQTYEAYLR